MRKSVIFLMLATLFAACTKDRTEDVALTDGTKIYATIADMEGADGRVQLNDKKQTVWNAGDSIYVHHQTEGLLTYQFDGKDGDRSGSFTYVATDAYDFSTLFPANNKYYAFYAPESLCGWVRFTDGAPAVGAFIAQKVQYEPDSYAIGANLMIAESSVPDQFTFENALGYLRLSLKGTKKVKQVFVQGNSNEYMCGDYVVDLTNIDRQLWYGQMVGVGYYQVIDCGEAGVQLSQTPTDFYYVLPPMSFNAGISIQVDFTDGTSYVKSTNKVIPIARNTIQPMAVLDVNAQEEDPVQFIFIYHTGSVVSAPYLEGVGLDGIIMWGDGNTSLLNEVTSYSYQDDEQMHTVAVESVNATSMSLKDFTGITKIDLSNF